MSLQRMMPCTDICVCNPITQKFTTFEIIVQTNNPAFTLKASHTRRRFKDFVWLRKTLKSHHPMVDCPPLPEKKTSSSRFEVQFLVQRMSALEAWLGRIAEVSLYLSDTALHLFLQTFLSTQEIDQYLQGRLDEEQVQKAFKDSVYNDFKLSCVDIPEEDAVLIHAERSLKSVSVDITKRKESKRQGEINPDSGIAGSEFNSDFESSSSDSFSSAMNSFDSSSQFTTKYPALTQVNKVDDDTDGARCGQCAPGSQGSRLSPVLKDSLCHSDEVSGNKEISSEIEDRTGGITEEEPRTRDKTNSEIQKSQNSHRVQHGILFSINN